MLQELKKKVVVSYNSWKQKLSSKEIYISLWQDGSKDGCVSVDYGNLHQRNAFVMALTMAQIIGKPVGFETDMVHWFAQLHHAFGNIDPTRLYYVDNIHVMNEGICFTLKDQLTGTMLLFGIQNSALDQYFDNSLLK
jgi:hypothetical protein